MGSLTSEPPLEEKYEDLFRKYSNSDTVEHGEGTFNTEGVEEMELPLIDLGRLSLGGKEEQECKREIALASQEWGFFQVVNHGISREVLERMKSEEVKLFRRPFMEKVNDACMDFPVGSYRWGSPNATSLSQLSWSEAFHVPMSNISCLTGRDNPR
ncbi:gibberellin 2-beta-dioxygenase 8-like [Impatiens glandulifera]|uniref:gibberellin 2-beta-dioxygenase 8-like n=1 Tax=Impatiens glandulifera TaxID=253017 RepID=UPI001FB17896|nr:gibberellin 2-beta-dioxygenase 8-like [Impatiens glandulifera]